MTKAGGGLPAKAHPDLTFQGPLPKPFPALLSSSGENICAAPLLCDKRGDLCAARVRAN